MNSNISAFLLFSLFINQFIYTGNFNVSNPSQFQSALNTAASNGQNDTINVSEGTYSVNPGLTFTSNENYSLYIKGTGSPVLDGSGSRQILQLTSNNSSSYIVVEGLTFQHGRADFGGGLNILTQDAAITVRNCTVNDNSANYVAGGVNLFSNTGSITVTNCSFSRNSSPNTSGYPFGNAGGLFIQTDGSGTTIRLVGCTFNLNTSQRDAAGAMLYPLGANSTVIAESNTFSSNTAKESGGGCWIRGPGGNTNVIYRNNTLISNQCTVGGNGAGTYIQLSSGSAEIYDNLHSGNSSIWQGGGIWVEHGGGSMAVYRNRFVNNSALESGGGANLFLDQGTAKIWQNIFNRNSSNGPGGGINFSTSSGSINIYNNTFFVNSSPDGGDVNIYFDNASSSSYFVNNILYNSTAPALSFSGLQSVTAKYCDIKGGASEPWFGTGCIDRYPFFRDTSGGDFHLQDSLHCSNPRFSPCIDAGSPGITDSTISCSWGLSLERSDMGAYGGKGNIPIGIQPVGTEIPIEYFLSQNYPNPFNPLTVIGFSIPSNGNVSLKIYDALGKELLILTDRYLYKGTYKIEWDAYSFPSGIYFCRLEAEKFTAVKKMVLIK